MCTGAGVNRSVVEWTSSVRLNTARFIVPMSALVTLNLVVISGNVMVIMAIQRPPSSSPNAYLSRYLLSSPRKPALPAEPRARSAPFFFRTLRSSQPVYLRSTFVPVVLLVLGLPSTNLLSDTFVHVSSGIRSFSVAPSKIRNFLSFQLSVCVPVLQAPSVVTLKTHYCQQAFQPN